MGDGRRRRVQETFDLEQMVTKIEALYRRLSAGDGRAGTAGARVSGLGNGRGEASTGPAPAMGVSTVPATAPRGAAYPSVPLDPGPFPFAF